MISPTPPAPAGDPPRRATYGYAQVLAFNVECPACGAVDCVRQRRRVKRTSHFNQVRSRWQCPSCRRVFAIGLAIWPVRRAGNRPRGGGGPVDTIPTRIQVMAILNRLGLSPSVTRGWHDPVNLVCRCSDETHPRPDCLLHGSDCAEDAS